MQISLANLLSFPPINVQPSAGKSPPTTETALGIGACTRQSRGLSRSASAVEPPKAQPQPTSEPPASPCASVVAIGKRAVQDEGVTYTRSGTIAKTSSSASAPDLSKLTLEKQLQVGRNLGVFTKITLHNDGVLVARPEAASARTPGFVASAVATMKDFQEGFATLEKSDLLYN